MKPQSPAVRIVEGLDLPEIAIPPSRIVEVSEQDRGDEEEERRAVAFLWRQAREAGELEERFRERLRRLGEYADRELPEWQPATSLGPSEAAELVENELAEPVEG